MPEPSGQEIEPTPVASPCKECAEKNSTIDALTTQINNMGATLASLVEAVNTVGAQQQWIVQQVQGTFANLQQTISQGGIRGLLGMVGGNNG